MAASDIRFSAKDVSFQIKQARSLRKWLTAAAAAEGRTVASLQYIWCSDEALWEINTRYLNHDNYTDIITFDYTEGPDSPISSDLFISTERIRENAGGIGISFTDELHRVMIHGLMHLCGYGDKTPQEKSEMTEKEDYYLSLRTF